MGRCLISLALIVLCSPAAVASDYPRLVWRISDEDLAAPLGVVADVGVDEYRTVYLLDNQVCEVRRIAFDGSELPPLGRKGEGPGEFEHPALVAANPYGGAIVVQDFHAPAVCLLPTGQVCAAPDLDLIRERFGVTIFMGIARLDATGRLIVAATTAERRYDRSRPTQDLGNAFSVFAIKRGDTQPTVLFTSSRSLGDRNTVRFGETYGFYPLRCWDVDAAGRMIYADPEGAYSVIVGHPAAGRSVRLKLPAAEGDEQGIAKRARAEGVPVERYPRIVDVQWVGKDRFLVKPIAAVKGTKLWPGGTADLFDVQGKSLGRRVIADNYDPEVDSLFVRGSILVIIRGGTSAMNAWLRLKPTPGVKVQDETIVVEAYDLTPP